MKNDVRHEVALPDLDWDSELDEAIYGSLEDPVYKGEMATTFAFNLLPFQQISISCLKRKESVILSAPKFAGKTVVANYAIAMACRDKRQVIYTSSSKALSYHMYKELKEEFSDHVGLMTSDVKLFSDASCLVMTTETLRVMLYKGEEVINEVGRVIFDNIQCERGVDWEESIIALPPAINILFLSATLSLNATEFSKWIRYIRGVPYHDVSTDFRPTPLK